MNNRIIITILSILLISTQVYADEPDYNLYIEANRQGNIQQALIHIERAYNRDRSNTTYTYNYGLMLNRNSRHNDAIRILSILPGDYNSAIVKWYLADSFQKLERTAEAVQVLTEAINNVPDTDNNKGFLYNKLFEILKNTLDTDRMAEYLDEIDRYYSGKPPEGLNTIEYYISSAFSLKAEEAAKQNNPNSFNLLQTAVLYYQRDVGTYNQHIHLYKTGQIYQTAGNFSEAIRHLLIVPQENYPLIRGYYLAESYKQTAKYNEALSTVISLYGTTEQTPYWWGYLYSVLFQSVVQKNSLTELLQHNSRYYQYQNTNNQDINHYTNYTICNYLIKQFENKISVNDNSAVDLYRIIKEYSNTNMGNYASYINLTNIDFLYSAYNYYRTNSNLLNNAYRHKILVIVLKELEAQWTDKEGTVHNNHNISDPSRINFYETGLSIMNMAYFYLTKGAVSIEYEFLETDSVIRKIKYSLWEGRGGAEAIDVYSPDLQTATPHLGQILYNNRNIYDTFIFVTPSEETPIAGTGGMSNLEYVPFLLYGTKRGAIMMGSTIMQSYMGLIHEFFHNIEGAYYEIHPFVSHIYRDSYRSLWPGWYKGEGELYYYEQVFNRIILPAGIDRLKFRQTTDEIQPETFNHQSEELRNFSLNQLELYSSKKTEAFVNYNNRDYNNALRLFIQAHNNYPNDPVVSEMIGYIYYLQNNFTDAYRYYKISSEILDDRDTIYMTGFLSEKLNRIDEAIACYNRTYELYNDHTALYNVGRLYYSRRDYQNAAQTFQKYLEEFTGAEYDIYALNLASWITIYQFKQYQLGIELIDQYINRVNQNEIKNDIRRYREAAVSLGQL